MTAPSPSLSALAKPLRSALKSEDERTPPPSSSMKAVQIAEPETPLTLQSDDSHTLKQFSAGVANVRLSGRPPLLPTSSSRSSIVSVDGISGYVSGASLSATEIPEGQAVHHESAGGHKHGHGSRNGHRSHHAAERLLAQVSEWLKHEKTKDKGRKKQYHHHGHHHRKKGTSPPAADASTPAPSAESSQSGDTVGLKLPSEVPKQRRDSIDSESSDISFDRLQRILDDGMTAMGLSSVPPIAPTGNRPRRGSLGRGRSRSRSDRRGLHRSMASSDTDYVDGDVIVPSCDAVLDNSKTLSYTMGHAGMSTSSLLLPTPTPGEQQGLSVVGGTATTTPPPLTRRQTKEEGDKRAWLGFKTEIIRLAHTLRLKGWRRVPLENPDAVDAVGVERLSGALTNAVYVVTPPPDVSIFEAAASDATVEKDDPTASTSHHHHHHHHQHGRKSKKTPDRLLLRVYGPQVEHLIDRDVELAVLRRLAKKKIGPRLLGTFKNGRFEQFFNASPLNPEMLREPDTSRLIARRMRELHDGVEVLDSERFHGAGVWKNWDKWFEMVDARMRHLDRLVEMGKGKQAGWKGTGFVCGVEWGVLIGAVERYRGKVEEFYRGKGVSVRERLVFAHNDTQYGNILRIHPSDSKSPLLQPANEHKQLVVIDFEYAAANTPGLEFANHFSEWTYNYHDPQFPYACNHKLYPTTEQQRSFIRAYVDHKPQFSGSGIGSAGNTPVLGARDVPDSSTSGTTTTTTTTASSSFVGPGTTSSIPRVVPQAVSNTTSSATSTSTTSASSSISASSSGTAMATPRTPSFLPHTTAGSSSSIVEFMLDARVPPGGWKEEERKRDEEKERIVGELLEEVRLWRLANSLQWVAWGVVQAKVLGMEGGGGGATPTVGGTGAAAAGTETGDGGYFPWAAEGAAEGVSGEVAVEEAKEGATETAAEEGPEKVESKVVLSTQDKAIDGYFDSLPSPLEPDDPAAEEFDYLLYAHERAMWVLGDCINMGVLGWEDVPEGTREGVKVVEY